MAALFDRIMMGVALATVIASFALIAAVNFVWWAIYTPAEFLAECALWLMRPREN